MAGWFMLPIYIYNVIRNDSQTAKSLCVIHYTPRLNEVESGVYWYHLVRLSVCGQNRVRSVSSTILIGSISYLDILLSNFRRCVVCYACFKIQKFGIFLICNFDFVLFWLGIQYDSMVWVIMRRRGVSSERRRSSCSSFQLVPKRHRIVISSSPTALVFEGWLVRVLPSHLSYFIISDQSVLRHNLAASMLNEILNILQLSE